MQTGGAPAVAEILSQTFTDPKSRGSSNARAPTYSSPSESTQFLGRANRPLPSRGHCAPPRTSLVQHLGSKTEPEDTPTPAVLGSIIYLAFY